MAQKLKNKHLQSSLILPSKWLLNITDSPHSRTCDHKHHNYELIVMFYIEQQETENCDYRVYDHPVGQRVFL